MKASFEERQTLIHASVSQGVFPRLSVNGRCLILRVDKRVTGGLAQFYMVYREVTPADLGLYTKYGPKARFMLPNWSEVRS